MARVETTGNETAGAAARGAGDPALRLEQHRVARTAYCYRRLGSAFAAADAVQRRS